MFRSIVLVPKNLGVCVVAFLTLPALVVSLALDPSYLQARQDDAHWVASWTSMPQLVEQNNLPPASFRGGGAVFKDATVRQTLHLSIGAERFRFQISNTFGGSALPVTAASVALSAGNKAGVNGIETSTLLGLTFNGSESVSIPRGQVVYSDPVDITAAAQSMVTLSLYSQAGQSGSSITGHPGSRTTSWMQQGNHVNTSTVTGANTKHWYFVSAVDAWVPKTASAMVILGDSITDGRGSTDDANNRWPDLLLAKMQKSNLTNIGINNQAAGGNAVLTGGLGPPLMQRYKRDLLQASGVQYCLLFEGVNDIGSGSPDAGTQQRIGDQLIAAFKQIASDAHKAGLRVFAATITPFGGNGQSYSNPAREATRQRVNKWILGGGDGSFNATIDFAKLVANSGNPSTLATQYDSGDHLHLNPAGYQAIADGFPLDVFN
ncbi:extracellular GDSL-like lipase/acylhydrolase [Apiospora sp. TS-2023a]